jgi:hypothetical protein
MKDVDNIINKKREEKKKLNQKKELEKEIRK